MILLDLPSELLLRVIELVHDIRDKCNLTRTCRHFNHLLTTNASCWSHLDFSVFECSRVTNVQLLAFLKSNNIALLPPLTMQKSTMFDIAASTVNCAVTMLDLSGCSFLTEELLFRVCQSFPNLQKLYLNGYKPTNSSQLQGIDVFTRNNLDILREHVYSAPSLLNIKSKLLEPCHRETRLNISSAHLSTILYRNLPKLDALSLQYQDLTTTSFLDPINNNDSKDLRQLVLQPRGGNHISYLDVSSCRIRQPELQSLLRQIGPYLRTLKLLNIDLNNLSWLCLQLYCKNVKTLHVSCFEPTSVQVIQRALQSLTLLDDIRVTNFMSTDLMNPIVQALDASRFKKLDLSPKLTIYPNPNYKHYSTLADSSSLKKTTSDSSMSFRPRFKTAKRDFNLTNESLQFLQTFSKLVELRLCYPIISAQQFSRLVSALSAHLKALELRLSSVQTASSNRNISHKNLVFSESYLNGLRHCQKLEELCLYSVFISNEELENLFIKNQAAPRTTLKYLIINEGGPFIHPIIHRFVPSLPKLELLCVAGNQADPVYYNRRDGPLYKLA